MAPFDHAAAPDSAFVRKGSRRPTRRREPDAEAVVKPITTWAFAHGRPDASDLVYGSSATRERPYSLAGEPLDLYAYLSPEDALVAWAANGARQVTDRRDRIRVLSDAHRRIFYMRVNGLFVMRADHPRALRRAEVSARDLETSGLARRRVARVARGMQGVGGLVVPPMHAAQGLGLVIFPGYVPERVSVIHSAVESVEGVVLGALGGHLETQDVPAPVLGLDEARQRKRAAAKSEKKKTSAS